MESPRAGSHFAVSSVVARAVTRTERLLGRLRVAFVAITFFIFLSEPEVSPAQVWIELLCLILATGWSVMVHLRTQKQLISQGMRIASSSLDVLLCGIALGASYLRPGAPVSILDSGDIAILPLLLAAALFRVLKRAVAVAGFAASLVVGLLMALGSRLGILPEAQALALILAYLLLGFGFVWFGTERVLEILEGVSGASF